MVHLKFLFFSKLKNKKNHRYFLPGAMVTGGIPEAVAPEGRVDLRLSFSC